MLYMSLKAHIHIRRQAVALDALAKKWFGVSLKKVWGEAGVKGNLPWQAHGQ